MGLGAWPCVRICKQLVYRFQTQPPHLQNENRNHTYLRVWGETELLYIKCLWCLACSRYPNKCQLLWQNVNREPSLYPLI